MRLKCYACRKGVIENKETCDDCKGTGSLTINIGVGSGKGNPCKSCKGKGVFITRSKCNECDNGWIYQCDFCGVDLDSTEVNACSTCEENPIAIELQAPLDVKYLDGKRALVGTVLNSNKKGVLVDLQLGFIGHFKNYDRNARYNEGDVIAVRLKHPISIRDRGDNQTVPVLPISSRNFNIVKKHLPVKQVTIEELKAEEGNIGRILSVVTNIYQIKGGPTLYDLSDEFGNEFKGSAYTENDQYAFPKIGKNSVVRAYCKYRVKDGQDRIQIYLLEKASFSEMDGFYDKIVSLNRETQKSLEEEEFFVPSNIYDGLKEEFVKAAIRIRKAILTGQNILMRYDSSTADGAAAAYAIDYGIRRYMHVRGARKDEIRRLMRRLPQRSPHFDMRDVSRDMSFALDDGLYPRNPLYVLVDMGSTTESKGAFDMCNAYGVDTIVIDHHYLDEAIKEKAFSLINPSVVDNDNSITTAMLGVELAKLVAAEHTISGNIPQLAAMGGYALDSDSIEQSKYLEMAQENGFDFAKIDNIVAAINYTLFGLRHFDGGEVLRNIFGLTGSVELTDSLIESITPTAKSLMASSLKVMRENVIKETLDNGFELQMADFENHALRFEYPLHSELLFAMHKAETENSEQVVSIGYGSNYLILKHSDREFKFNEFLNTLQEENMDLEIRGYGHKQSGSIQFYQGFKDDVFAAIKTLLAK